MKTLKPAAFDRNGGVDWLQFYRLAKVCFNPIIEGGLELQAPTTLQHCYLPNGDRGNHSPTPEFFQFASAAVAGAKPDPGMRVEHRRLEELNARHPSPLLQ